MKAIHLRSHVGTDGVLSLKVPTEIRDSDLDVLLIVHPTGRRGERRMIDAAGWAAFVASTAGSIPDPTFRRPDQGEYEVRQELP